MQTAAIQHPEKLSPEQFNHLFELCAQPPGTSRDARKSAIDSKAESARLRDEASRQFYALGIELYARHFGLCSPRHRIYRLDPTVDRSTEAGRARLIATHWLEHRDLDPLEFHVVRWVEPDGVARIKVLVSKRGR